MAKKRSPVPPPTVIFKDRQKEDNKRACRKKIKLFPVKK